jgi:hypothetical protein
VPQAESKRAPANQSAIQLDGSGLDGRTYRLAVGCASAAGGVLLLWLAYGFEGHIRFGPPELLSWIQITGALAGLSLAILALLESNARRGYEGLLLASVGTCFSIASITGVLAFLRGDVTADTYLHLRAAIAGAVYLGYSASVFTPNRHADRLAKQGWCLMPLFGGFAWSNLGWMVAVTICLSVVALAGLCTSVIAFVRLLRPEPDRLSDTASRILAVFISERETAQREHRAPSGIDLDTLRKRLIMNRQAIEPVVDQLLIDDRLLQMSDGKLWLPLDDAAWQTAHSTLLTARIVVWHQDDIAQALALTTTTPAPLLVDFILSRLLDALRAVKPRQEAHWLEMYATASDLLEAVALVRNKGALMGSYQDWMVSQALTHSGFLYPPTLNPQVQAKLVSFFIHQASTAPATT